MAYKAESPGKSARHDEAQGSGDTVNAAVVSPQFTSLSGEICPSCDGAPIRKPPGDIAGWGHRLTKSRRYPGGLHPESRYKTVGPDRTGVRVSARERFMRQLLK